MSSGEHGAVTFRNGNAVKLILWILGGYGAVLLFIGGLVVQMTGNRFTSSDALQFRREVIEAHRVIRQEFHDDVAALRAAVDQLIAQHESRIQALEQR